MINSKDFSNRLQKIMDFHSLSASAFADTIGVQRSSISHILTGRNKPSLEFVMKILTAFDDVDMYWLLNGIGRFPSESKKSGDPSSSEQLIKSPQPDSQESQDIERIVIFYKDGSFKNYGN